MHVHATNRGLNGGCWEALCYSTLPCMIMSWITRVATCTPNLCIHVLVQFYNYLY